jgi:Na+/alanine symporter
MNAHWITRVIRYWISFSKQLLGYLKSIQANLVGGYIDEFVIVHISCFPFKTYVKESFYNCSKSSYWHLFKFVIHTLFRKCVLITISIYSTKSIHSKIKFIPLHFMLMKDNNCIIAVMVKICIFVFSYKY